MKIYKVANEFEDEGRDPLEQIEDRDTFDFLSNQNEGPHHTSDILSEITPSFVERLDSNYTLNGAEGLFEYKDGKVYRITIEPAKQNQTSIEPIDPNDDITM